MTELVRLTHGLHRRAETTESLADRCAALLAVLPPGTVIGGLAAALLHELWLPPYAVTERIEFIETGTGRPRDLPGSRRREIRVRRRTLGPDEIVILHGLPVTSECRTWIDLAERLSIEDLVAAGDSLLRGSVSPEVLAATAMAAHRRRGVRRAREALPLLNARSRSRGESHLRCTLVRSGLPVPAVNEPIYSEHGEWLAEPDLHYRRARLALEYNGAEHAGVKQMRKDITREIDIDQAEWQVVVFGAAEVFGHPYRLAPYVRSLLDRRDPGWWRRGADGESPGSDKDGLAH